MSQAARKIISFGTFAGIVGLGYFLMKFTVPDKDALMERMSDDLTDKHRLSKIQQQNHQLMKVIQKNIDSSDPVWKLKSLDEKDIK